MTNGAGSNGGLGRLAKQAANTPLGTIFTGLGRRRRRMKKEPSVLHVRGWRMGPVVALVGLVSLLPIGVFTFTLHRSRAGSAQYLAVIGLLLAGLALPLFGWRV